MTQGRVIKAYKAILELANEKLPAKTAYQLFKLKKALQASWDFQVEQEQALLDQYKPKVMENGSLIFANPEDSAAWKSRIDEINALTLNDLQFEPVKIPEDAGIMAKMEIFDYLDGFIYMDV